MRDPGLLVFDSDHVLSRSAQMGDLFAPVLKLRQKLPTVEALRKLAAAGDAVRPSLRAASKPSAKAGERPSLVSEQLTQRGNDAPRAVTLRPAGKQKKAAKPLDRKQTSSCVSASSIGGE